MNQEKEYKPQGTIESLSVNNDKFHIERFEELYKENHIDVKELRKLAWIGLPRKFRAKSIRILSGYLTSRQDKHENILKVKREQYLKLTDQHYENFDFEGDQESEDIKQLCRKDAKRTFADSLIFKNLAIENMLVRLLFVWNIRHPASGYIQGMNDIAAYFVIIFFCDYFDDLEEDQLNLPKNFEEELENTDILLEVEADTYHCLCGLLNFIKDNYTDGWPGIKTSIAKLSELIKMIDMELFQKLEDNNVLLYSFAFQWICCLMLREFPVSCSMKLLANYLSLEDEFGLFLVYLCAALLMKFSKKLKTLDAEKIRTLLQAPPTEEWGEEDIKMLLAEAHLYKKCYDQELTNITQKS